LNSELITSGIYLVILMQVNFNGSIKIEPSKKINIQNKGIRRY